MALVQEGEIPFQVHQQHDEGDHNGRVMKGSHEILDGKYGAVPVGIDGHHPVDHGKRKGDDDDEYKDFGTVLQFLKEVQSAHGIFFHGQASDDHKHQDPEGKIGHHAQAPERQVQIGSLVGQQRIVIHCIHM